MENSLILSNYSNLIIGGGGISGYQDDGDNSLNPNEPFDIEFFIFSYHQIKHLSLQ